MTSEWMGLHNPERHEADVSDPRVKWCPCFTAMTGHMCTPDRPCPCCVEAEAERLRALVQRVREVLNEWRADDNESLATFGQHAYVALAACADMLQRALDGGDA